MKFHKKWLVIWVVSSMLFVLEIIVFKIFFSDNLSLNRYQISFGIIPAIISSISLCVVMYDNWFKPITKNIWSLLLKIFYIVLCLFFISTWLIFISVFVLT